MYFSIGPKTEKRDFFNYEYEYSSLEQALKLGERIVAITGVRRVGKTSLMNIFFNQPSGLHIWIDGRMITAPKREIPAAIMEAVRRNENLIFGQIESLTVSIAGIGVGLKLSQPSMDMLRSLKKRVVVFIDEAQRMRPKELADVLSYFYDMLPQITFVLSGSEVGLLNDVLGENDPSHPLFGRHISRIHLRPLEINQSLEYLRAGFKQLRMRVPDQELQEVVERLGGLIGWLTLYGYERGVLKHQDALKRTEDTAVRIAAAELENFLRRTRNQALYLAILRNADGLSWSELHTYVNKSLGKFVNPNSLNNALTRLLKYAFLIKRNGRYYVADPLLVKASFMI